jgi:hypothetical protein
VSNSEEKGSNLDRILSKYVTIWVWSILVGLNTTVTFSLVSGVRSRGPEALTLIGPVLLLGVLAALVAWYFLIRYLHFFVVPNFFWNLPEDLARDPRSWQPIQRAGSFMLIALAFRLLLVLLDFVFSSGSFGLG